MKREKEEEIKILNHVFLLIFSYRHSKTSYVLFDTLTKMLLLYLAKGMGEPSTVLSFPLTYQ